jgi:hypothetical protein
MDGKGTSFGRTEDAVNSCHGCAAVRMVSRPWRVDL